MKEIFLNHNDLLNKLKNTNKYIYAFEIYHNISNKKNNCCNPHCKMHITLKSHFVFDSYYCSHECKEFVYSILHKEWSNITS